MDSLINGFYLVTIIGYFGIGFCYWWNCEYRLMVCFWLWGLANVIMMTVKGVV